jgi:antitoxin PrlF
MGKVYGLTLVRKFLTWQTMITSKLTSKAQTTIPLPVRNALRLVEGDEIVYLIEGDRVILSKASREPIDDPFATFSEWSSEADRVGYAGL